MSNIVPIPELDVFEAMPEQEQKETLITLRDTYSNHEIRRVWKMYPAKFTKLMQKYDLPKKKRVTGNTDDLVSASGSAPAVDRTSEKETGTAPSGEKATDKSSASPSVLSDPILKDFIKDNSEEAQAKVQEDLNRESNNRTDVDTTQGQVFEFVKICNSAELARKLKGLTSLVDGEENNFNVSIHLEEIIPIAKAK